MTPYGNGSGALAGRVSITSPYARESIEFQVDCTQNATPWINVTRCKKGLAVISQARAISYYDSTLAGDWSFVDIYVSNSIPASDGVAARLTIALDIQGVQGISWGPVQLLSPIIPVSATTPTGASVTMVNTYR